MPDIFIWSEGIIHEGGVLGKNDASTSGTLTWRLNHLETLTTNANTKLDTVHTDLGTISANQTDSNTFLGSIDTKLTSQATGAKQDSLKTSVDLTNTKIGDPSTSGTMIKILTDIATSVSAGSSNTAGSATAGNQTTGNASLSSIDTKLTNAATTTLQTTGNTSLGSIDTKLTSQATAANQATLNTTVGVGNTSLGSIDTKLTSQATAANQASMNTKLDTLHTDLGTVETKQDTGNASLASIDTKLTSQATAALQTSSNTKLDTLHADLIAPTPSGTNLIGIVSIDQITANANKIQIAGQGTTSGNPLYVVSDILDYTAGGNISALNGAISIGPEGNLSSWSAEIEGATFNGSLVFEVSQDGGDWFIITGVQELADTGQTMDEIPASVPLVLVNPAVQLYKGSCAGYEYIRVRCSSFTSGSVTINLMATSASGAMPKPTAQVIMSATINSTDQALGYPGLDNKMRMRVVTGDIMDPWQTSIAKYWSITTSSTTDVVLANATTVAATNYPPQSTDYTVAAGRTFYLKKIIVTFDSPPGGQIHITLTIGGTAAANKLFHYEFRSGTLGGAQSEECIKEEWVKGFPVAAGSTVQFMIRTSAGPVTAFARFEGYEEIN